jgi:hypothetical protein
MRYLAVGNDIGWLNAWWYVLVQASVRAYGIRGPAAVVFITAGFLVLLGVKRMRVVPIETEIMDELSLLEPVVPRARRKPRPASAPPLALALRRGRRVGPCAEECRPRHLSA